MCLVLSKFSWSFFRKELEALKNEGIDISRVRPMVTITLDSLIINQDRFAALQIPFHVLLEQFILHLYGPHKFSSEEEKMDWLISSFEPFSFWLNRVFRNIYIKGRVFNLGPPKHFQRIMNEIQEHYFPNTTAEA